MMKLANKHSNKLSSIAKINIPAGSTFIFQATIHINTKPTNQARKLV
jgi:hypothetical protein